MKLVRFLSPLVMLVLVVALAGCTSSSPPAATSPTSPAPTIEPTVPTTEPTEAPTTEPTATPVANCMDPEVYTDLTATPPLDWAAVPQTQRDRLADELETYDFGAASQEYIDRTIGALRSGSGLDPGFINGVLSGELSITSC